MRRFARASAYVAGRGTEGLDSRHVKPTGSVQSLEVTNLKLPHGKNGM